ncbi:reverse transcriptase, partial [Phytophthora megakarya]
LLVHKAFITLKTKIATTPILRHIVEARTPAVIVYASDWAISASLTQEHDEIYHPVAFSSRTLKTNELNYNVTEKEVLALLRILDLYYKILIGPSEASFSVIVWSLPGWEVVKARSGYLESLTVNEAEYNDLLLGLDMLEDLDRKRLVICGDTNLVIRQVRGEIDCKTPGLTLLKWKALDRLTKWSDHELVHVKRDWNGSTDMPLCNDKVGSRSKEGPNTKTCFSSKLTRGIMQEDLVREMRVDRIRQAQEEEGWITGMNKYLGGSIADFTQAEARSYGKIAADYDVDEHDLLVSCPPTPRSGDDRDRLLRLVVPEMLDQFHWRGLYRVQRYVGKCVDCKTGKGKPVIRGESPGNLQAAYPFQIIAMDHIPSLPRSHNGNTDLWIWVDLFTGYVIAKTSSSRSAQTVSESYEECVFRRFGASKRIRHAREPGFMSDFFRAFNKILE